MRYDHKVAMVLIFANMSISTGVVFADDKLKGAYALAGAQTCLVAPSGFAQDSKGNPTIPNGNNSFSVANNFQARVTFNGDGTGSITGTFVTVLPPQPDSRAALKASVSAAAGTFSYAFTHTPVANNSFNTTLTPGTYQGVINYGPRAGQQFTIDPPYHRVFQVSNDQKYGTVATTTPDVEHITYSDPSHTSQARICFNSGSLVRLD
jgi:hypothetical protein